MPMLSDPFVRTAMFGLLCLATSLALFAALGPHF